MEYSKARTGVPGFASFVVSKIVPDIADKNNILNVVELGVGSGQQTEFIEKELTRNGLENYNIYAYDKSFETKSTEKPGQLNVLEQRIHKGEISRKVVPVNFDFDGHQLPIETDRIDFGYMAHVFHHLKNKQEILHEMSRVTHRNGKIFILGATIEDLEHHPLNEFFPMKLEYDAKRYPTEILLRQMFESAGFTYEMPFSPGKSYERPVNRAFLASIENTTLDSVLRMIKVNDLIGFHEGTLKVQKEVEKAEKTGNSRMYSTDMARVFWGHKK